jgi:hypothetical protein
VTRSCSIFGDPHAGTFDGFHADYYTSGEFYLVRAPTVKIQGKYNPTHATNGLAVTKEVAISGSFVGDKILIIGEEHASYDGMPILTTFPSTFSSTDGKVKIVYNGEGQLLQPGREGKNLHVIHVSLPDRVSIQINRWDEPGEGKYVNAKITMPKMEGMDGQCGNFNGIVPDDSRMAVRARMGKHGVPESELLFPGPKTEVDQAIEDCADATLVRAHAACKAVTTSFWPKMECLETVCKGGVAA